MSRSVNKTILLGNLGKDPEVRHTGSGIAVATFSIATSEQWKDDEGNQQEKTEWHNIVVWRKLAEICGQYLKKGSKVYIEGKLQHRTYDDKNGVKRYVTEIVVNELVMLDSRPKEASAPQESYVPPAKDQGAPEPSDDLPF